MKDNIVVIANMNRIQEIKAYSVFICVDRPTLLLRRFKSCGLD